jgi:hypothetical protein
MDPLVEAAASAIAHLYDDEDNWQDDRYLLLARAVVERIEPLVERKKPD